MSKQEWQKHRAEVGPHDMASCPECAKRQKTRKQNARRRERDGLLRDLGLTKTRYGTWE